MTKWSEKMGILSGNQKEQPLHCGEVFAIWTNLTTNQGLIAAHQTFYNHAGDTDLKKILEDSVDAMKDENKYLERILKENGIGLPPAPPERPVAQVENIPPGAKFNDPEIAAALAIDGASGLVACSKAMGISTREDIATMYGQFHMKKAQLGAKLLQLTKEKGWLILPPVHTDHK